MKEEIFIERDGQTVELSQMLKSYAGYAERAGKLPPSGTDEETQRKREEWYNQHAPCGVWTTTR